MRDDAVLRRALPLGRGLGRRGCRQEQFQWNGVYSKRTDEGLGDCWMRGNQLILI